MLQIIKQGLSASSLLDRGVQLMGENNRYLSVTSLQNFFCIDTPMTYTYLCLSLDPSTPYTPLDKRAMENTDEDTTTDDWSLEQPLAQTRTTAIVEVKGAINVVLTPLVAESLDRYYRNYRNYTEYSFMFIKVCI